MLHPPQRQLAAGAVTSPSEARSSAVVEAGSLPASSCSTASARSSLSVLAAAAS